MVGSFAISLFQTQLFSTVLLILQTPHNVCLKFTIIFRNKENQTPTKSVNAAFKLPFKKTVQKTSPGKLFEDPEDYFARIIAEDNSI